MARTSRADAALGRRFRRVEAEHIAEIRSLTDRLGFPGQLDGDRKRSRRAHCRTRHNDYDSHHNSPTTRIGTETTRRDDRRAPGRVPAVTGGVWGSLERWRSVAFLAAGVAFLAIAINAGVRMVANTGVNLSPLVHLGVMVLVYAGLLGVTPRLVKRAPRLGRVCQVLVLVFGLETVLTFGAGVLPVSMPRPVFALTVATGIIGAALTVTVFGATSLRSRAYSRAVGGFLVLAAVGLYVTIGKVLLFGDIGGPEWVPVVSNGTFGLSLAAVGLLLRSEAGSTEQADSTETVAS